MHHSEITTLSLRDLIPHLSNPRKLSVDILAVLADALGKRIVLEDK